MLYIKRSFVLDIRFGHRVKEVIHMQCNPREWVLYICAWLYMKKEKVRIKEVQYLMIEKKHAWLVIFVRSYTYNSHSQLVIHLLIKSLRKETYIPAATTTSFPYLFSFCNHWLHGPFVPSLCIFLSTSYFLINSERLLSCTTVPSIHSHICKMQSYLESSY